MKPQSLTMPGSAEVGQTMEAIKQRIWDYFSNPDLWANILLSVLYIILIYVGSRIVIRIADKAISHLMMQRERSPFKMDTRRTKTIGKLVRNIVLYTVNFIAILLILSQIGVKLGPLLAGAGVVGLAIGFGAQSLVKDVITGFFIIFEDQFAVGDVIQTGTYKGTVEEIGLRITRIRSWTGEMYIIPNGSITQVTNFSTSNLVGIDIALNPEADIDLAERIIRDTIRTAAGSNQNIVKTPDVLGVQSIGDSEVILRVTAECRPDSQFSVARALNEAIQTALEEKGIEIPQPRLVTYQRTEKAAV